MNDRTITVQTQQKIKELSHFRFRLWKNYENYKTLEKIFLKHLVNNHKAISFLKQRNLIHGDNIITPSGLALIIAHKFSVRMISVFVLSKIYHYTIRTNPDSILPRLTLMSYFESFSNKETIRRIIFDLKQKNILESISNKQLRFKKTTYNQLLKFNSSLIEISNHIDDINEQIEELINNDPLVQKTRSRNLKM